jgi:CRISPR-associated protein Cas2
MWLLALFDLPVTDKKSRRNYTRFRRGLIDDGFMMLQFSVYGRPCPNDDNVRVHTERVKSMLPPEGEVRLLALTEMQYARMEIFLGKELQETEKEPDQLEFY